MQTEANIMVVDDGYIFVVYTCGERTCPNGSKSEFIKLINQIFFRCTFSTAFSQTAWKSVQKRLRNTTPLVVQKNSETEAKRIEKTDGKKTTTNSKRGKTFGAIVVKTQWSFKSNIVQPYKLCFSPTRHIHFTASFTTTTIRSLYLYIDYTWWWLVHFCQPALYSSLFFLIFLYFCLMKFSFSLSFSYGFFFILRVSCLLTATFYIHKRIK